MELYDYYQETLREYAALANSDLTETLRMEFSELKAEAYSSLGERPLWLSGELDPID